MPSEASLVRLHRRVIEGCHSYQRTQAQWRALIDDALYLEDIAHNEVQVDRVFRHTVPMKRNQVVDMICSPVVEWYWQCLIIRPLLRGLGVFTMILSAFVVWSEVTFFNRKPVLSLAAVFVDLAARNYDYSYIELSSVLTISYLCLCAYYTVFKVKIYRYYHLDPHHQTDDNSLLFSAILLSRLTPPLCLNFLGLIHLDSHLADESHGETAYTQIMGHLDVIPIISKGFNVYFPMAILLLCLGTYFRLGTKLLHFLGFDQFMEDDDMTGELVQSGKALVTVERNKIHREVNRGERAEFWQEKLGDHDLQRGLRRGQQGGRQFDGAAGGSSVHDMTDESNIIGNAEPIDYIPPTSGSGSGPQDLVNRRFDYGSRDVSANKIFDDL